jgi:hypothetical protein
MCVSVHDDEDAKEGGTRSYRQRISLQLWISETGPLGCRDACLQLISEIQRPRSRKPIPARSRPIVVATVVGCGAFKYGSILDRQALEKSQTWPSIII